MRANRGRGWESRLDHQHEQYRRDQRAILFRAHPATKVLHGRAIRQKGPPDYFGTAQGRPVLFDAKSSQGVRFSSGLLKPHQARALEAWQVNGGLAGIALRLAPSEGQVRTYWVDWRVLGPLWWAWAEKSSKRASVGLEWLEADAQSLNGGTDWLAVVSP